MNRLILTALASGLLLTGGAAGAMTLGTAGDSFTATFNGIVEGSVVSGLTAETVFTLNSKTSGGGQTTFAIGVDLTNTSSSPIDASRVSNVSFDTAPDVIQNASSVSGDFFNTLVYDSNVPQANTTVEVCATAQGCPGGGSGGAEFGESGTFVLSLVFAGESVGSVELTNLFVRYQSIDSTELGLRDDSGIGVVPIPAAVWLFGSAMLALLGLGRAKRQKPNNVSVAGVAMQGVS